MARRIALVVALLLVLVLPALAQDGTVEISFPPSIFGVYGVVPVRGTVDVPGLQGYLLEVAPFDPAEPRAEVTWAPASLAAREPVIDGVLAEWDTTRLADGLYQLRLRAVLSDGSVRLFVVAPLRVANALVGPDGAFRAAASATPTPLPPTPTPELPPTPVPTPTVVPRPAVANDLPVPVGGHIRDFNEPIVGRLRSAGLTWLKWQIRFVVGDDSLLAVARDRISWSHQHGFLAMLSIIGDKDELGEMREEYYPRYAEFVGRVAALGPDAIQVWNEMNLDREWPQGQIDPAAYVALLRPAYEAIKAADASVKVITGAPAPTGAEGFFGSARVWNDDRYYLGMANAGAAQYADCIGIHYNEGILAPVQQGGDPRGSYPTYYFPLMIQRAAWPFRNTPIPFCFSELGYLSPEGYGTLPQDFAWAANTSVAEQAAWLRDAVQMAAQMSSVRIDLIIIWNLDFTNFEADPQAGYAIIRPDGTCPACDTLATLRVPAPGS